MPRWSRPRGSPTTALRAAGRFQLANFAIAAAAAEAFLARPLEPAALERAAA